jgi:hypothetical protein
MRIAIITLATSLAVGASPDMPSGTSWGADARSAAMAHAFWTDSANWNLYDLAGHSAVLPGLGTKSLELRVGTQGLSAEGDQIKTSQTQAGLFQIRGAVENKAGYRLDLGTTSQSFKAGEGAPEYEASRLRWGFDLGTAFGPDRLVGLGLGARLRLPSNQTQDTSGAGNAPGSFERWQPGLEALRVGMAIHFAKSVTLAGKFEASADVDTLEHVIQPTSYRSLHRFGVVRLPVLSFSAQFQKSDFPIQGITDLTFGTVRRIGVMKTVGGPIEGGRTINGANVDFPTLVGDSLRFLMGAMGSWTTKGHTIRPLLTFEVTSLSTQVYEPIKGTKDPFKSGPALLDTGWITTSQSAIMGCSWAWDRGVGGHVELSSTKRNLNFDKGMEAWEDESHTDMGMAWGLEVSHRVVPAWKEKIPSSMDFSLRLGWERKSLSGTSIEQGYLAGLTTGYESPESGYSTAPLDPTTGAILGRGWSGQEDAVGLAPSLGGGSDLNLLSYGLGASFLEGVLQVDAALQSGTWTPNGGEDLDAFGWRAELRWSP